MTGMIAGLIYFSLRIGDICCERNGTCLSVHNFIIHGYVGKHSSVRKKIVHNTDKFNLQESMDR